MSHPEEHKKSGRLDEIDDQLEEIEVRLDGKADLVTVQPMLDTYNTTKSVIRMIIILGAIAGWAATVWPAVSPYLGHSK